MTARGTTPEFVTGRLQGAISWAARLRAPVELGSVPLAARPILWGTRYKLRGLRRIARLLYTP